MNVSFIIGRAVLAVVLMVGFYLLALGIASALLWIPYAELVYAHRVTPKLAIICVVGGLAILWSVLPRFDKFTAPGPQLQREKYPKLFAELESVAQATQQAMPAEVYLVPDVNAWVAQRGGIMGLGSRRVMGLGLPLMRILTCSQFRAVLAHEFGHYHGGDTKIGPWIYKTRGAIGRTLHSLGDGSWLQAPFRWYGNMFLRITHAVSRRQEFVADELAARAVGAKPLADGLRSVHKVAPAYDYYWRSECAPVLHAGFLPPLADGFNQFINAANIAQKMDQHLEEQLADGKVDPFDTHPPLKDRVAAVAHLPAGPELAEDLPAVSHLEDVPGLERELVTQLAGPETVAKLKAIGLKGVTSEALVTVAGDLKTFGLTLVDYAKEKPEAEQAEGLANGVVGAALTLLLTQSGATLHTAPGEEISLTHNGTEMKPFGLLSALQKGELTAETWRAQCAGLNLAGVDLATAAGSAP